MTSYQEEIDNTLEELLSVPLRVLIWGPGITSNKAWFEKRKEVVEALKAASGGKDEIFMSEELFKDTKTVTVDSGYVELVHAQKADVIIALVMASPDRQGGVYRELEICAPHPDIRNKVWIFMPDVKKWLNCFQAGMFSAYRDHQKIPLRWKDLKACENLRNMCRSKVEEERRIRMMDRLMAMRHSEGQSS
jgi:hypothetical protein